MNVLHIVSACFVLSSGLLSASCASPDAAPGRAPREVAAPIDRVRADRIPAQFEAGGIVRGRVLAVISSRLLAPVVGVHVKAGDMVRAGQALVTLDGRELRSQANRADAALAAARQSVRAAESERTAADAAAALAATAFDRIRTLHEKRSATQQEFDEAKAAAEAAQARTASAAAHVSEAAEALTAADEAAKAAAVTAGYAVLTSPFAGQITERSVDPGVMAAPGMALLTVEDTSRYRIEVSLDESRAASVTPGRRVAVSLDGERWYDAIVGEVSRLDVRHGFVAKIDLPPGHAARPGTFGRARFDSGSRDTLTVPARALVRRGQMTFVFVVDADGLTHLRPVSPGAPAGERQEVLAGVLAGESIVGSPPPELNDGDRVSAVKGAPR